MRYLILSDIHGSRPALERVLAFYDREHYDRLLLLGDLLNYGPRNGLPEGLDPLGVADLLNERAAEIVAVRGNCDSEVDQMLLRFPIMADYAWVADGRRNLLLTHGHVYGENHMPPGAIDVLFCGHTHLQSLRPATDSRPAICNSGSPTFPKGGNPPTFATFDNGLLCIRNAADGSVVQELAL